MSTKLYSYNRFSKSAKELSNALGIRRIKHTGSKYHARDYDVVINWGSSTLPANVHNATIINSPGCVSNAADKIEAFNILSESGVNVPEYTTSIADAKQWAADGSVVVCRTLTRANSGRGIVIAEDAAQLVQAPLYTKYFRRKHEYRVHVVNGEIIDVQRKMRKRDVPDDQVNWQIRSHNNGFVFGREGVEAPECVKDLAVKAVAALGLHFGAVDIGYSEKNMTAVVFEVNTAPGLEGQTLDNYKKAFSNIK